MSEPGLAVQDGTGRVKAMKGAHSAKSVGSPKGVQWNVYIWQSTSGRSAIAADEDHSRRGRGIAESMAEASWVLSGQRRLSESTERASRVVGAGDPRQGRRLAVGALVNSAGRLSRWCKLAEETGTRKAHATAAAVVPGRVCQRHPRPGRWARVGVTCP